MAILQISRITHRKGYIENLPQLAGAEFGWALDERRLYIGNGQIEDGAPVVGNTEILTQFSDLLELSTTYTYKGTDAGYVVQTGEGNNDVVRSLQEKFDETVSVRDFGAVGDWNEDNQLGHDDTDAINRAFYQLFCRETNTPIRRALYFPAGTYKVSGLIKIPPYAKVYGDGINSSTIMYYKADTDPLLPYVVEMSDSKHQVGVNLGNNGATQPTGIDMTGIDIISNERNSLLLLENVTNSSFSLMSFKSVMTKDDLNDPLPNTTSINIKGVELSNISFNKCVTAGTTYGLTINSPCKGFQFENSSLSLHYQGINIGNTIDTGEVYGVTISRNIFDLISNAGIVFGNVRLNSSAFNVFYDVGNQFSGRIGVTTVPSSPIIDIHNSDNVSIGDLFERTDDESLDESRIELNGQSAIAFDSASAIFLGTYERQVGLEFIVPNANPIIDIFTLKSSVPSAFKVDYSMLRNSKVRMGQVVISSNLTTDLDAIHFDEEYTESSGMGGIKLSVHMEIIDNGGIETPIGTTLRLAPDASGGDTTFKYSITRLD